MRDKNASEKQFQENFVAELTKYRWQAPDNLNGNLQKVTVQDLVNNWRQELNRINADILEGIPLTDSEFSQVMSKVNQITNSYEAAKILSMEGSIGKIDGIYRDANPNVTRQQITLTILKKAQVSGGDSSYQVAREVWSESGKFRFDLVLLINGLPLINIEQKRSDITMDEAIVQFTRYYRAGDYTNNFMAFSQMMVVTSDIETRYFATPKSINDFNPSFVFHWSVTQKSKEDGKYLGQRVLTDYRDVIEHFLMVPMAHQMVGDYLIIDEDPVNEENRRHMLMRPYQVYALQAVEKAAFGWDNPDKVPHGGFVWHTTGSGKTITSFKTAQFLSTRTEFDKVVFLLDRKDLDEQTSKAFKAYATYESVNVDDTKSTYQLRKQLMSVKSGIVVTTTFKLSYLVNDLIAAQDKSLADKKILFIIDEAHRTTMGDMMGTIKEYFFKNGLFFGFTGTPLFDENKVKGKINERSEVINTTEKLFGPLLHQYTIDEAIEDGNVLGFHVDYINTGEFVSYEDLREKLIDTLIVKEPERGKKAIERQVQQWTELEVEKNAVKEKILIYQDVTHIPRVVEEILSGLQEQSQNFEFNAMLTVAYKKRVIDYYNEFKKQISEKYKSDEHKPNIAMTFSFGNENDPENVPIAVIEDMFSDYAEITGIAFLPGDKKKGENAYFEDVTDRFKRGGSGRNPKNIDIIIVADQLLTGYDAKRLNTLYVDRSLELQGLIQAYSRTNRVFGSAKEFGTIINFQYPRITEETVNEALKLYGSGGQSSRVLVEKYPDAVRILRTCIDELITTLPQPTDWIQLKSNEEGKENFKLAFKETAKQLNRVEQYYEYAWNEDAFGITEHTWLQYVGAYKNLFPPEPGPEPGPIRKLVGRTKLQGSQIINAQSLFTLIGQKTQTKGSKMVINDGNLVLILEQIQELSNMGENELAEALRTFINEELRTGHIPASLDFDESFKKWQSERQFKVIQNFADEWGIDSLLLQKSLKEFDSSKSEEIPYISDILVTLNPDKATNQFSGKKLLLNMELNKILPQWMIETKNKYK
ncbi:type I restriction endonuclease subunit R, EcoR124 family [Streptococcus pacificus]|uniref:Type I restriction enzyme endonuclease subunit n=1 Tax=Streptococcus pacificus TaxID=2740577 RepID=A0ABS0ZIM4_9STRE|nr:HsdR family type I site-specific deoxyribonuclease [Streptococcus pacificus]MBJ8325856.1 HsdR family type I site-specific deoxyribonuclease [Streptococcus pacificus]